MLLYWQLAQLRQQQQQTNQTTVLGQLTAALNAPASQNAVSAATVAAATPLQVLLSICSILAVFSLYV